MSQEKIQDKVQASTHDIRSILHGLCSGAEALESNWDTDPDLSGRLIELMHDRLDRLAKMLELYRSQ